MFHLYMSEMEARARRADARREQQRREHIRMAMENGTLEYSGLLVSLGRFLSGLSGRINRRKQRLSVSPARATQS